MRDAFTLDISTGNAAFQDSSDVHETARILRDIADRLERGERDGKARDANGNTVGAFHLTTSED